MMISAASGFINQTEKYSRDNAGQSLKKYTLLKKGELAYNHGASKIKPYGCCFELLEEEARIPYVYHCFKINNEYSTSYIAKYLNNSKTDSYLKKIVSSSVRMDGLLNISYEDYTDMLLIVPSITEQQKIADFLSLIDKRIEKQRLLVENLKKYKRGLFVQLYNQSAKNKIQIKNLGEYFSAGILSKEDIVENGSNPCILYGELFTKYNEVIQEVYSSTNKNILSKTIGTEILFPSSTTVDALSLICPSSINQKDIILGGDLFAIKLKKDFDNDFMSYLFNYIYKRLLAKFAQGITIVHLHYSDIKEQFIEVPSIQEQIKIIKIINNIEIYILKNEKIYEQLKFIKQGLLQQMFI